jgi:hypothetical protein
VINATLPSNRIAIDAPAFSWCLAFEADQEASAASRSVRAGGGGGRLP